MVEKADGEAFERARCFGLGSPLKCMQRRRGWSRQPAFWATDAPTTPRTMGLPAFSLAKRGAICAFEPLFAIARSRAAGLASATVGMPALIARRDKRLYHNPRACKHRFKNRPRSNTNWQGPRFQNFLLCPFEIELLVTAHADFPVLPREARLTTRTRRTLRRQAWHVATCQKAQQHELARVRADAVSTTLAA